MSLNRANQAPAIGNVGSWPLIVGLCLRTRRGVSSRGPRALAAVASGSQFSISIFIMRQTESGDGLGDEARDGFLFSRHAETMSDPIMK